MNLEKITKKQFQEVLGKSLTSVVDECVAMMNKIDKEPTDIGKYYDTLLTLLDSANHNAALYCRVDCMNANSNIFYLEKDKGIPVLKFSKTNQQPSSNAYM
jgi:hypothetical protein